MMLEVVDNKGHTWDLCPLRPYIVSPQGLVELWCGHYHTAPEALAEYESIPIPVFTEWWN